ncbi:MAG: ankyrin repeat domain-containing protein [Spirochaetota bacterium]
MKKITILLIILFSFPLAAITPIDRQFLKGCEIGNLAVVKQSLERGANMEASQPILFEDKKVRGATCLIISIVMRQNQVAKYILLQGANINHSFDMYSNSKNTNISHLTPLHACVMSHNKKIFQALLVLGADMSRKHDIRLPGRHIKNANILLFCIVFKPSWIRYLLQSGVSVNTTVTLLDKEMKFKKISPLFFATMEQNIDLARKFIVAGADVNQRADFKINERISTKNYTPLIYAAIDGNVKLVRLLLQNGADPNIKGTGIRNGKKQTVTALGIAKRKKHYKVIELLKKWQVVRLLDQWRAK